MTTLNTAANEQMREKARLLLSKALVKIHPEGVIVRTDLNEAAAEVLAVALQEAHAAGRQEILDRLPSDEERRDWIYNWTMAAHAPSALDMFVWLKSRLTGESK